MFFVNLLFFFFKQKTAYEMRISDWSSDVCSSDLQQRCIEQPQRPVGERDAAALLVLQASQRQHQGDACRHHAGREGGAGDGSGLRRLAGPGLEAKGRGPGVGIRSEEHTSELQSLMRISYAVFCLKKKKKQKD